MTWMIVPFFIQEGLLSCLKTLTKCDLPWVERLDVTAAGAKEGEEEENFDPNDDFKREMAL